MPYTKQVLPNKLRLIHAPVSGTKTVTVLVLVGAGSKYEIKRLNGVSHFLEHLFFKGTKKRPNTKVISEELDRVGGVYNAFTGKEFTGYWVKVDSSHLELALDVVSDMLLNSKFEAKEINREKGVIIEELNMYRDLPMNYVGELFETLLYGDQPAGWDIGGDNKNIINMTRQDIVDYKDSLYVANNTVVCLAGNIPAMTDCIQLTHKYFKLFKERAFKPKAAVVERQSESRVKFKYKKTDQTHLVLGVRGFHLTHVDAPVIKLMSTILGGNMSSRMFLSVRERHGLAYYVHTDAEMYTDVGYIATAAGIKNKEVLKAVELMLKEYRKIKSVLVKPAELAKAKEYIKGKALITLETSNAIASYYTDQEILKSSIDEVEVKFKELDRVTAQDIRRVANKIFVSDRLNLALIGPYKDPKIFLKILHL